MTFFSYRAVQADVITVMRSCGAEHVLTGHDGRFLRLWRTSDWSDVLTFRAHKWVGVDFSEVERGFIGACKAPTYFSIALYLHFFVP